MKRLIKFGLFTGQSLGGLARLGEMVGKVDSEELPRDIFSTFCIGK